MTRALFPSRFIGVMELSLVLIMYDVMIPLVTSGASHVIRAYVVLKIVRVTLVTGPINNIRKI